MTNNNNTTEITETEQQIAALAAHLSIDQEDIEPSDYDNQIFTVDGDDYLVCNNEDADARAADYIMESLWAFNPGFIIDHSELPYDAIEMISGFCESKCEDANDTIATLITDMNEFIDDAIASDSRGHFLNSYDGEEYISEGFYIYQQ